MFSFAKIRAAAGILAAMLSAGELGAFAHAAFVQHAICEEHGEPIHALTGEAAAPPVANDSKALAAASTNGAAATDDHDHCKLSCGTPRLASPSRKHLVIAVLDGVAPLAGTGIVIPPAVSLFRLSPKNSPPFIG